MLVLKRIHVRYTLQVDADADRDRIQRAFEHYKPKCPVYRSISKSIAVTDELRLEGPA